MIPTAAIHVDNLSKTFDVPVREAGVKAAMRSLVRRHSRQVKAVDRIAFDIAPGEVVGFLGPNGAGKTTTLKMLSGLLYPTAGEALVLGHIPSRREKAFLSQITLIMGNRHQLQWDIPALDSFDLNRSIYHIPDGEYKRTRDEFVALLDLQGLVHKPIRNLSLGERMKMEIVGALLHRPQVLFLDEPTIGLDVTMQRRLREFIAEYNRRYGATVLLTSHYMADVVALCQRVIVIHHGRILFDGGWKSLVNQFSEYKTIVITLAEPLAEPCADLARYGEVMASDPGTLTLRVPKAETRRTIARLLTDLPVDDLTIQDAPVEHVIERVFAQQLPEEPTP